MDAITSTSPPQLYHETGTDAYERWMAVEQPGSLRPTPCFSPRETLAGKRRMKAQSVAFGQRRTTAVSLERAGSQGCPESNCLYKDHRRANFAKETGRWTQLGFSGRHKRMESHYEYRKVEPYCLQRVGCG